jgi:hypothetical protein
MEFISTLVGMNFLFEPSYIDELEPHVVANRRMTTIIGGGHVNPQLFVPAF